MGWRRVAKLYVSISSVKSLCGRSTTRRLYGRCSYLIWSPTWSTARCKIQISEVLQCVRLENGAPTRTMAPPAGGDPTHTPHKTRLPCDFSSCNRPILVYDLVYASGGQCQGGVWGVPYSGPTQDWVFKTVKLGRIYFAGVVSCWSMPVESLGGPLQPR